MKNLKIIFVLIFIYNNVYSQKSNCHALLEHGISNVLNEYSLETLDEAKYFLFEGIDLDQAEDATIGSLDVKVFGMGSGTINLSVDKKRKRLKERKQEMDDK